MVCPGGGRLGEELAAVEGRTAGCPGKAGTIPRVTSVCRVVDYWFLVRLLSVICRVVDYWFLVRLLSVE